MKKIAFIMSLVLLLSLSACGTAEKKESTEKELYAYGLEVASVMEEMIQSEEYMSMFFVNNKNMDALLEGIDTKDYDSPIAVYRISQPDAKQFAQLTGMSDEFWNALSDNLKEQVMNRVSVSSIFTMINAQYGDIKLAFSASCVAIKKNEKIAVNEATTYLYVFEKGIPIAVTFSETGVMNGQFVFLEDVYKLSDIQEVFKEFKSTVTKVDIG